MLPTLIAARVGSRGECLFAPTGILETLIWVLKNVQVFLYYCHISIIIIFIFYIIVPDIVPGQIYSKI